MSQTGEDPQLRAQLTTLRRQYLQVVEPAQLRWPESQGLKAPHIQAWIFDHFFNLEKLSYPPPERYQLRVLKLLVSKLEDAIDDPEEDEISDDLLSSLSTLISSNLPSESSAVQQKTYVTYSYPLNATDEASVTILESRAVLSGAGTTGLRTWEAALHLASFLVSNQGRQMLKGRRVLELGAGTGMLSVLCAKHLGVSGMVATDGDEAVVDAIKTNVFLNQLDDTSHAAVRTAALKWGWPVNASSFAEDYGMEVPDVLLGADVTYDRSVMPLLVSTMREFFQVNPALQILLSPTIRKEQTFEAFVNACRVSPSSRLEPFLWPAPQFADPCGVDRNGFTLEQLDFPLVPEQYQDGPFVSTSTPIQIWRITQS